MNKYTLSLVFLCTLLFLGLSWQGELNPTEFDKWEGVRILHQDPFYIYIIAQNRDEMSVIRFVSLAYRKEDKHLMEYSYFKHGEVYVFKYYKEPDEYRRVKMEEWENKRCLNCHQDESKERKAEDI